MKTVLITLIASFLMLTPSEGQWVIVNNLVTDEGEEIRLSDVSFINRDKGIICGGGFVWHGQWGCVFMTRDGGNTWETVLNSENFPRHLHFRNDSTGYLVSSNWAGGSTIVYETVDSGKTWIEKDYISGDYDMPEVIDMFFLDEFTGFAALNTSDGQHILKTRDGGESWEAIWDNPGEFIRFNSIFFVDENHGWAWNENHLIEFSDQASWKKISTDTDRPLNALYFCDATTGWIAGGFSNDDGFYHVLLKTEDGGGSWNRIDSVNYLIYDIYFRNIQEGWAVGEDADHKGMVLGTADGGMTWQPGIIGLASPLYTLFFKDGNVWAVGDSGLIVHSTFGSIWIIASAMENAPYVIPGKDTVSLSATISNPFDYPLEAFSVINSQEGDIQDTIAMICQGDNLWRAFWPAVPGERYYGVNLLAIRNDTNDMYEDYSADFRFTTRGPVRVQDCYFTSSDTLPNPADVMQLALVLKNEGLSEPVEDINVRLTTLDEYALIGTASLNYPGTLPAGDTIHVGNWKFSILSNCPYGTRIPIKADISTNNYIYWSDTVSFVIAKPQYEDRSIPHIYPNPVRNTVNIDLPLTNKAISIELYNQTGTVFYRKTYSSIRINSVERIDVSHLPAGIYLVKVVVGQEVTVEKLLVY